MISVVIIAKNEEKDLPEAIKSVSFADQVVVVNDQSIDQTVAVAQGLGASVVDHRFINYADQRNFGASQARHNWILSLDADERVTPKLGQEILDAVKKGDCDSYQFQLVTNMFGRQMRHGEVGHQIKRRLYRKDKLHWERPVHEILVGSDSVGTLAEVFTEISHQDLHEFVDKINRYSDLDAQAYHERGVREPGPKVVIYPLGKFIVNYFIKLGFLDGLAGLILATVMSFNSFLTRVKLRRLWDYHENSD